MPSISFCKFHGFGNDYIVFEAEDLREISSVEDFARAVCHRHTGIGGDGIAVLEKLETEAADYSCRIINPDGSEAGFSGNGTRCAVAYLFYKNLWSQQNLRLETKSGIKNYHFLKREEDVFWFRAELGKPKFELPENSHFGTTKKRKQDGRVLARLFLPNDGLIFDCVYVDVGNPVVCIFLEDFTPLVIEGIEFDWRQFGRKIECATEVFPEKTNVVFIKGLDQNNIEIRIWERGAGETSSSGTCSIAAAVASAFVGKTGREVSVHAPGGMTEAAWREDGEMLITGRADLAFCGECFVKI